MGERNVTKEAYAQLESYMLSCMEDSAHDKEHVYRVLSNALAIGQEEPGVDWDVLIAACLLHDIGRKEQLANPSLCHGEVGSEKAHRFLVDRGFGEEFAGKVRHCVLTHRFRKARPPQTLEARILFDADKLDVTGALGIARTLMYKGDQASPLYTRLPNGEVSDGSDGSGDSFFREYKFKLEKLYGRFYTQKGAEMAQKRRRIAADFYESLLEEVAEGNSAEERLKNLLEG